MRIILEEDPAWEEVEVTIRCKEVTPQVAGLVASLRRFDHRLTGEREGKTYLEIAEKTGASTATISRVNRSLNYGNDGYDLAIQRIQEKQE